jgi:ELWxxDGT repeat protein
LPVLEALEDRLVPSPVPFQVADVSPGGILRSRYDLVGNVNGTFFFNANDGTHGDELWRSDGTAVGTTMVADINKTSYGFNGSFPSGLVNVNGTLFFGASNGAPTSDNQ